jgi:hypothetical protein
MVIQLLFFPGCPNVDGARESLRQALLNLTDAPSVTEIDVTAADTPPHLRAWGSPTILIDGVDVAGQEASGMCCRLYPDSETRGSPSLATIEAALRRAQERTSH